MLEGVLGRCLRARGRRLLPKATDSWYGLSPKQKTPLSLTVADFHHSGQVGCQSSDSANTRLGAVPGQSLHTSEWRWSGGHVSPPLLSSVPYPSPSVPLSRLQSLWWLGSAPGSTDSVLRSATSSPWLRGFHSALSPASLPTPAAVASPARRQLAQEHVSAEQAGVGPQLRVTPQAVRETVQQFTKHENIYTVPNALCVMRIATTPLIGWLVVNQMYTPALIGFCLAGGTDMLDGWIARKFPSQASRLGSFLDPLADKLLMTTLVVSLTYSQLMPPLLTLLIVGRDIGLIAAASWVRYKSVPPPVTVSRYFDVTYATAQLEPTTISKVNTCIQLALVASTLAAPVLDFVDHTALHVLWCITAGTTVTSGLIYALLKEDTFKLLQHQR